MGREDEMKEKVFAALTELFFGYDTNHLVTIHDLNGFNKKINERIMPIIGEVYSAGWSDGLAEAI